MHSRDASLLSEILPPEERAVEHVVARYQRVAPAVTRLARTLAGNDQLRVRLGARAAASSDEVVVDPGVFQAAYGRRAPVTPEEVALASALHEVIHLVSTDLEERRPLPPDWYDAGTEPSSEPLPLLDALHHAGGPAAERLFFSLEDARQERQGFVNYPGARSVLLDLYQASVAEALRASPPLGQFAVGCFVLVGDYLEREALERRCDPRVAIALADTAPFLEEAAVATDPWVVAGVALQLLALAKLHGLVTEAREDESHGQRMDREQLDETTIADAVDRIRLTSPIVQSVEGYESTKQAAEPRPGESHRRSSVDIGDRESIDQLLRVSQAPTVYLPSGQSGKLIVTPIPDRFRSFGTEGRSTLSKAAQAWGVAQRHVSGELYPLFAANQRRGLRSGYDAGDVSPHAALFLGAGLYQRLYERRSLRSRRSYAVSLLVDGSASMLQPRRIGPGVRAPWGMAAATLGAWTLARLCDELQIDFEVALFNRSFAARVDDTEWSFSRRRSRSTAGLRQTQGSAARRLTSTVNHYLVKSFDQRWRDSEDLLAGLFWTAAEPADASRAARREPRAAPPVTMFEKAANVDEFNVSYAALRMGRLGAKVRVLVVLADGMTRGSVQALARSVEAVEQQGTTVLGIGIGDATVDTAYARAQVVERPDELTRAMVEGTRGALRRSLALWGMDGWWTRAGFGEDPWKEQVGA